MSTTTATRVASPSSVGQYRILRCLAEGDSLLATDGDRRVVLKPLDTDCLQRRQLHPMVRDRLGRIRELSVVQVANLRCVERTAEGAYLVWEYIDGVDLCEWLQSSPRSLDERRAVGRHLISIVQAMHARGIVHGAIHPRNVIVTAGREVRLTHVSPFLYDDIAEDTHAVARVLEQLLGGQTAVRLPAANGLTLRDMAGHLATFGESQPQPLPPEALYHEERCIRRSAIAGALAALSLGISIAYGLWWLAQHR